MTDELHLRRKLSLHAHGQRLVLVKRSIESTEHVVMKALLWALYLPLYPDLQVEVAVGGRYRPDVVAPHLPRGFRFWGECGHVGRDKMRALLTRHRDTHFALARWGVRLQAACAPVEAALAGIRRQAPVDILTFPPDASERFIAADGQIKIRFDDLGWCRL